MKFERRAFLGGVLSLLFSIAVLVALWQRQALIDWWLLRDYTPPAAIAKLAEDTAMSEHGKHLFYVYHPVLEGRDNFRSDCTSFEQSIVLGCYKSLDAIYIFDIDDPRLGGVEEVTAAHEMLHVAYERLSRRRKAELKELLDKQELQLTDERIKNTLASYRADPSSDIYNEMHSIFGTELEKLIPELESHYSRYFDDRAKVVAFSKKYEAEFLSREQRIAELDAILSAKKVEIDSIKSQIEADSSNLEQERSEMVALRNSNPEAFNSRVDDYNASVRAFNRKIDQAKVLINEYNLLIEERNNIALEKRSLLEALDSSASAL